MFAPFAAPESRWKAFLAGWGIQAQFLAAVLALNVLFPQQVRQAKKYVVMNLVAPIQPSVTQAQPMNRHLQVKIKPIPAPLAIEAPERAKLVIRPQLHDVRRPEPEVKPPHMRVISSTPEFPKLPNAPLAKVMATNTFAMATNVMPSTARPAAQVQTGGFGDPNGIAATGDGKHDVNIAAKGNLGLPLGAGFGNGLGGAKGTAGIGIAGNGVVQSSGFDKTVVPGRRVETIPSRGGAASPVEIISKHKPAYTEEARKIKIEGEVRLEVRFTADGQVHVLKVLQGLGYGLDEQAVRCAEQIRFKPAMHDGRPVDSAAVVHIVFELAS